MMTRLSHHTMDKIVKLGLGSDLVLAVVYFVVACIAGSNSILDQILFIALVVVFAFTWIFTIYGLLTMKGRK